MYNSYKNTIQIVAMIICLVVPLAVCCGCNGLLGKLPSNSGNGMRPPSFNQPPYSGEKDKLADFSLGLSNKFYCAHGYCNGGMFDTYWSRNNLYFDEVNKTVNIRIRDDSQYAASAAEYRTVQKYGYGYFTVKMKPVKKSGVVSSFFIYTGPAEGTRWDEIDIEFLGKDTAKVQFNYFAGGKGNHEYVHNLGFDASTELHEYGFLWTEESIIWFVDGIAVYKVTKDIPTTPARIMINAWVGKSEGANSALSWTGKFDGFPVPDVVYQWIGYKPIG